MHAPSEQRLQPVCRCFDITWTQLGIFWVQLQTLRSRLQEFWGCKATIPVESANAYMSWKRIGSPIDIAYLWNGQTWQLQSDWRSIARIVGEDDESWVTWKGDAMRGLTDLLKQLGNGNAFGEAERTVQSDKLWTLSDNSCRSIRMFGSHRWGIHNPKTQSPSQKKWTAPRQMSCINRKLRLRIGQKQHNDGVYKWLFKGNANTR